MKIKRTKLLSHKPYNNHGIKFPSNNPCLQENPQNHRWLEMTHQPETMCALENGPILLRVYEALQMSQKLRGSLIHTMSDPKEY